MTKWKIYNEDAVEWARRYNKKKFHALLCDPPYHLTSITKRFGKKNSAPAKYGTDGVFTRSSSGFMGQTWDGGDVAFDPDTWAAFGEVLYSGAFGMAFSSSRSWHRLAVAIEDAGFVIHPTIFLWSYGSGFPKATRVKGQEKFDSHRYGLQALKPACEPIIVFQKPYEGKPIDNIVETGAGALNIDGGRIGTKDKITGSGKGFLTGKGFGTIGYGNKTDSNNGQHSSGRWPANFILDEEAARRLDAQSGDTGNGYRKNPSTNKTTWFGATDGSHIEGERGFNDSGGASRFFYTVSSQLDESDPVYYCSKASGKEREAGLEDFEPKNFAQSGGAQSKESQGEDEYLQDSIGYNRITKRRNIHPTCKPIDLARYLATLLLPPADYAPRRILVPFSGVASEMIGCGLAGWEQIVGVEFDKENGYIDIANARLEHWLNK